MPTEEQALGETPELLRRERFCRSRLPSAACPYSQPNWNGLIVRVPSFYQPSGKFSAFHLALLVASPAVLGTAAGYLGNLLAPRLGWAALLADAVLGFGVLAVLARLLSYCRSQFVGLLAGLAGIALAAWAWHVTGVFYAAGNVKLPGLDERLEISVIRLAEFALGGAIFVGMAWFNAKDDAYCEKCEKPMEFASDILTSVSPLAILYALRKGWITPDLTKLRSVVDPEAFQPPHSGVSGVGIRRYSCAACGDGLVNAHVHFKQAPRISRDPILFYSEPWKRAEIEKGHRSDALPLAGAD